MVMREREDCGGVSEGFSTREGCYINHKREGGGGG